MGSSAASSGVSSRYDTLPASDSPDCCNKSPDAEPSSRKRPRPAIRGDRRPKRCEQTGHELYLVEHQQAVSIRRKKEFGLLERGNVRLALEIQHHGLRVDSCNGPSQRGLANLAWPRKRHGRRLTQAVPDRGLQLSLNHHCISIVLRSICNEEWRRQQIDHFVG